MLHVPAKFMNEEIVTEVYMGISYSSDTPNSKNALANATKALKFSKNKNVKSNFIYFREI